MRKRILIIVAVLVVLGAGGAGGWFYWEQMQEEELAQLNQVSRTYADQSIRAIVTAWDGKEIDKRAVPELKGKAAKERLEQLLELSRTRLGALKKLDGVTGDPVVRREDVNTATYSARGQFEQGNALIRVQLLNRGAPNDWQLATFAVSSPALEAPAAQAGNAPAGSQTASGPVDAGTKPLSAQPMATAAAGKADEKAAPPKADEKAAAPKADEKSAAAGKAPAGARNPMAAPDDTAKAAPAPAPAPAAGAAPAEPAPMAMGPTHPAVWTANVDLRRCLDEQDNKKIASCALRRP